MKGRHGRWLAAAALALALTAGAAADAGSGRGADGRFERRDSPHFVLLQDVDIDRASGWRGSVRFEREVLAVLEGAYAELDRRLDLRPRRKIEVWIYDPRIFDAQFGSRFGFSVAGFYAGAIRVRGDVAVTGPLSRTLHHELVHAALDAAAPSLVLPAWLNEGLAEWFEHATHGRPRLDPAQWEALRRAAGGGTWLPIAALSGPSFARLPGASVPLAYLQAHALIDHLDRRGARSLADLVAAVFYTRDVERALERTYRLSTPELESALLQELL